MTTQQEIMGLERKFWEAMRDMDVETAASLLDQQSTVTGGRGIHYFDPAGYKAMARSGGAQLTAFEFLDEGVIFPIPQVAIASYKVRQSFTLGGKTHEHVVYDTTTWVKKRGKWLAVAHTETPEQKPPAP